MKRRSSSTTATSIAGWAIKQIALPLRLDRQFSFDNYFAAQADFVIDRLRALIHGGEELQLGLWGGPSSGKTHLLNACAAHARAVDVDLQLYDARQMLAYAAADFSRIDRCAVLAVDNLDAVAGNAAWEACFYQIVNRCRDGEFRFLYSLSQRPEAAAFTLDDLSSRLQWGLLVQLPQNGEREVRRILRYRARLLGLDLSDEVVSYLMTHHPRDLAIQMAILQTLDGVSLAHQRRITIPLIKQALSEQNGLRSDAR